MDHQLCEACRVSATQCCTRHLVVAGLQERCLSRNRSLLLSMFMWYDEICECQDVLMCLLFPDLTGAAAPGLWCLAQQLCGSRPVALGNKH